MTIYVIEAQYQGVTLGGAEMSAAELQRMQQIVDLQLTPGTPLNTQQVERAKWLVEDLVGVDVRSALREGAQQQATQVVLEAQKKPWWTLALGWDNAGATSTGNNRLSGNGALLGGVVLGDVLNWSLMQSQGSSYYRLDYNLPLGYGGWRLGLNASEFNYSLLASFSALNGVGASDTYGLELAYPFWRAVQGKASVALDYDHKAFVNQAGGALLSQYGSDSLTASLRVAQSDGWGGAGRSSAVLSWQSGYLGLDGSPTAASDAVTLQSAGAFSKLKYSLSREQSMWPSWSAALRLNGQLASKNLDSSEKLFLGGADAVRAFPAGESGGSDGQLLSAELHWLSARGMDWSAFYDWGQVQVNHYNDFSGAPALNQLRDEGYGLGWQWQPLAGLVLKASWARRSAPNPNPGAGGADQDGTLVLDRYWFSVTQYFDSGRAGH